MLFGAFGETTLIEGGRRVATTTIAPHASPEDKVGASVEATAAIDRETLAYQWCGTNECHVGIVRVDGDAPEAERLRRSSEHVLPRCTP